MASLNKIMLIGNVGSDPEMRYTPSGKAVTSFRMATNHRYQGPDGERKEETEWFRVSVWGRQAETTNQYLSKGRRVYVEGRLQSRTWEGQDGQPRFSLEVSANQVIFLDRTAPASPGGEGELEPEDLPFD